MKVIYKYKLDVTDRQSLQLPKSYQILKVDMQNGVLCLWALVDPDNDSVCCTIDIIGTGHAGIDDNTPRRHLNSVFDGPFVWHVFEVLS